MTDRRWTDDDITLAWVCGRDYAVAQIEAAASDIAAAPSLVPPQPTAEERIAERIALFEACAERFAAELARAS